MQLRTICNRARRILAVTGMALLWSALRLTVAAAPPDPAGATNDIQPSAVDQMVAILEAKAARTPVQQKMDSQLLQAVLEMRGQRLVPTVALDPVVLNSIDGDLVAMDVSINGATNVDAFVTRLQSLGGSLIYASPQYETVRAMIHLSDAETVAALPEVKFIQLAVRAATSRASSSLILHKASDPRGGRLPLATRAAMLRAALPQMLASVKLRAIPFTGSVNSQGDRAHRADDTRSTFGFTGAGIRVGVLSDSYNATGGAAADVTSGNLPGTGNPAGHTTPVTVLQDFPSGEDEGRAMLQIVHDLAPDARLYFATADVSEASFASNIQALRNAPNNCDIIIDDVFYYDEPVFQDGIVAQAVSTVTAGGALYFSSAGNEGSVAKGTAGYYEGDFNSTGSPTFSFPGGTKVGTIHNFGTSGSPINGDIILTRGDRYTLSWSDPQNASANDYDLFLVSSGGTVKAQSTNVQNGSQTPFESILPLTLVGGDRLIVFKANTAAVRAFSLNTFRGTLSVATTGQTHGHSAIVEAFSVAAASAAAVYPSAFSGTSQAEGFTSDGPRRIFYQPNGTAITPGNVLFSTNGGTVRNKPDITAADGVSTTLPLNGGLNPFYGTSAAAPHAGAIAALLKSANPSLTPAQIRTILTTTAVDVESAGFDNITGIGIVQAFQAMQAVSSPGGNCGTQGASMLVRAAPAPTGLPPGGTWQHEQRKGGETWTYSFSIADAPGTITTARPTELAPAVSARMPEDTQTVEKGEVSATEPQFFGEPLRQWFVDSEILARAEWHQVEAAIAGEDAAAQGTTTAVRGGTPLVTRLVEPVELAGNGLTAFDAGFESIPADRVLSSVRVFLELSHPSSDQLTVALGDERHLLVVWNGREGGRAHDSGVTIERVLSKELIDAPLSSTARLYILDRSGSPRGVLQQAWIVATVNPLESGSTRNTVGALATLDIGAIRSYMRTAPSSGGSEVDPPTIGQTVYFHGDFQVTGSGSAVTITQRAVLDGSVFCSGSAPGSPGFIYTVSCNGGWAATAGSHTLRWDYDYGNTVAETNEANNSASKSFTSGGLDIGAIRSYMRTAPSSGGSEVDPPTIGQTVYLHGDFQVTGSGSAVTITQRAVLDGSVFCSGSAPGSPGFIYTVSCNGGWAATAGSHTLSWDYDYGNTVAETNENNNSATKSFTSGGLDIGAIRSYMRTAPSGGGSEVDPPTIGQTVYFHGDFQVTGSGSAVTITQRAVLDGSVFCSGSAPGSPGFSYTVSCNSGWTATTGPHTLQWDFDYGNTVSETNESNNSTSKSFTTAGGSLDIIAQRAYLRTASSGGGSEVSSPNVGQAVYFHADYQVSGSGSAVNVTERALLDGTTFCSCSNNAAPGSSYTAWCNQSWTATAGSHTLRWDFDYNNSLAETNEGNNSASKSFSTASLTAPANVVAIASSSSQINVSWTAVAGAASYQIFRNFNNSGYQLAGTSSSNSFSDGGLSPNTAYLYQVRAVDGASNVGPQSNIDLATTVIFVDDPIGAGTTVIKAVHLTSLRIAVNAVRITAGLPAASFTDGIGTGVLIRTVHINELHARLDEARAAAGLPALSYANTISPGVSLVRAVDVMELRNGVK